MAIFSHPSPPRKTTPPAIQTRNSLSCPPAPSPKRGQGKAVTRCFVGIAMPEIRAHCPVDITWRTILNHGQAALRSAPPASAHFQDGGAERHDLLASAGVCIRFIIAPPNLAKITTGKGDQDESRVNHHSSRESRAEAPGTEAEGAETATRARFTTARRAWIIHARVPHNPGRAKRLLTKNRRFLEKARRLFSARHCCFAH